MKKLLAKLFPGDVGHVQTPAPYSRITTRYAREFGGCGGYIMSAAGILAEISEYVRMARCGAPKTPVTRESAALYAKMAI
jgi:hypothetical protein